MLAGVASVDPQSERKLNAFKSSTAPKPTIVTIQLNILPRILFNWRDFNDLGAQVPSLYNLKFTLVNHQFTNKFHNCI